MISKNWKLEKAWTPHGNAQIKKFANKTAVSLALENEGSFIAMYGAL
jgi:hypothetical protein